LLNHFFEATEADQLVAMIEDLDILGHEELLIAFESLNMQQ